MQAKERRNRHFKASVGHMLNENYGDGLIPNTVQHQDFLYVPPTDIPTSELALDFLHDRLRTPHFHKPRSIGTSDSLYQAYRRAFAQPVGMVHYERDPLYWKSKSRPGSDVASSVNGYTLSNSGFNGYHKDPGVPDVEPASTIKSVSTARSSRTNGTGTTSGATSMTSHTSRASTVTARQSARADSETGDLLSAYRVDKSKMPAGRMEDNRHRLWTPGSEAKGFKPYSPFSDSLQDFGKKEAKYIAPEIKPEYDRTCDVLPAPVYQDALKRMLDINSADERKQQGAGKPSQLHSAQGGNVGSLATMYKLHGYPDYPDKVMDDKDVPNYVAWAKIYPYCPLTQVNDQDKPVVVPPRGFTPSTPSNTGIITKLRDKKKEKKKILEGIKLLSSSSKSRRGGGGGGGGRSHNRDSQTNAENVRTTEVHVHPRLKDLPPSLAAKLDPMMRKDLETDAASKDIFNSNVTKNLAATTKYNKNVTILTPGHSKNDSTSRGNSNRVFNARVGNAKENLQPSSGTSSPTSNNHSRSTPQIHGVAHDPYNVRRLLDMKMKAPTGWYGGQTPTHTPTPEPSLPIKASGAWAKHHSPARVRRFLAAIGGIPGTPEGEQF